MNKEWEQKKSDTLIWLEKTFPKTFMFRNFNDGIARN